MRRSWWLIAGALIAGAGVPAAASAADSGGGGPTNHFGPFPSVTTDNGSCGTQWAIDTVNREFVVRDNGDGTFFVREEFKQGNFVTTGPVSPGACEADSHHGEIVRAGVTGSFNGYLEGTVTSSTYNPAGCDVPDACTTTAGFLLAVFGPSGPATFTCFQGFAGCNFKFDYAAGDQGLIFHHWTDRETKQQTEEFKGDIASA